MAYNPSGVDARPAGWQQSTWTGRVSSRQLPAPKRSWMCMTGRASHWQGCGLCVATAAKGCKSVAGRAFIWIGRAEHGERAAFVRDFGIPTSWGRRGVPLVFLPLSLWCPLHLRPVRAARFASPGACWNAWRSRTSRVVGNAGRPENREAIQALSPSSTAALRGVSGRRHPVWCGWLLTRACHNRSSSAAVSRSTGKQWHLCDARKKHCQKMVQG
jgi:hypothetical protein